MPAVITAVVVVNILVAAAVALRCMRARKACDPTQRLFMWVCLAYVLSRASLILPPAHVPGDIAVLSATMVDTVLLAAIWSWCRRCCPGIGPS